MCHSFTFSFFPFAFHQEVLPDTTVYLPSQTPEAQMSRRSGWDDIPLACATPVGRILELSAGHYSGPYAHTGASMNEERAQNQVPASETVEKDEGETTTENISKPEAENPSVEVPAVTDATEQNLSSSPVFVGETGTRVEEETKTVETEPPVDWFEPLEDDDAHSFGGNDPEEESLAGESERSESVAGSEKIRKKMFQ